MNLPTTSFNQALPFAPSDDTQLLMESLDYDWEILSIGQQIFQLDMWRRNVLRMAHAWMKDHEKPMPENAAIALAKANAETKKCTDRLAWIDARRDEIATIRAKNVAAMIARDAERGKKRRGLYSKVLAFVGAAAFAVALLLSGCSPPSDPNPVDPIIPTDTTQTGYWRSDEIPGVITWEIRQAVVWLIPPVDSPYSLESTMIQDGDTLRIDAWHVTNPGLVYAFALAKVGQEYHGRFYSPKGIWKQRAIIFRWVNL